MASKTKKLGKAHSSKESTSHFQMLIAGAMALPMIANSDVKPVTQNGISIKHGQATPNFSRNLRDEEQPERVFITNVAKKGGDIKERRYLQLLQQKMAIKPLQKGNSSLTEQVDDYSNGLSTWKNRRGQEV
ncbi:MAG: hypothetical protein ACYSSO_00390 [Planctomycetota bacterium]|jgi:hypothetical protein